MTAVKTGPAHVASAQKSLQKNNAIQLVPCVFSDALHLCLASGSGRVFLVSVIWPKYGECGKMQKFSQETGFDCGKVD